MSRATFDRLSEIIDIAALRKKSAEEEDLIDEFQSLLLQTDTQALVNPLIHSQHIQRQVSYWSLCSQNTILCGGYTLLQKSAEAGLALITEALLKDGSADPNGITDQAPLAPLLLAANKGHLRILELLHEHKADFTRTCLNKDSLENVLHCLLKNGQEDNPGYGECIEFVLNNEELSQDISKIVNKRDAIKNTPLHYATQMWPQETVRMLLEVGANIGMKNHWEEIPISHIDPQTMEDFLDDFCLGYTGDVNHDNFEITFNYSFLAPPKEDLPPESRFDNEDDVDPESQKLEAANSAEKVPLPETQSLWYIGQSKDHQHLLKHPVITSLLYLKWNRIRRYFNRNLR